MGKKISKTGVNRTSADGYHALLETQHDINVLIREFDSNANPGGRTLSAVCSRAIEELKLATTNKNIEIFSISNNSPLYVNPLISVEETIYENTRTYKFSTVKLAIAMHRFPLLRPTSKLPFPRWYNEAAFVIEFDSKKSSRFSRYDVLSTVRNDIGAHFVEDISSRYHLLSQEHQGFRLMKPFLAGPPGLESYWKRPVIFLNSPLPYVIRAIAAEIQVTIYYLLRSASHNERPAALSQNDPGKLIIRIASLNSSDKEIDSRTSIYEKVHKDMDIPLRE